jgi:hypothetical protein
VEGARPTFALMASGVVVERDDLHSSGSLDAAHAQNSTMLL